eukprot:TRINITY_DN7891_c0_g2_i2.p1 TRINITY_DN7891_c0_g2~~TRINITY_DN7891_c0_g2_i2.p1  ORF type:complete len:136 (-),score=15.66 TRINITY_DN7891_c0_g2_i2:239-646(-)
MSEAVSDPRVVIVKRFGTGWFGGTEEVYRNMLYPETTLGMLRELLVEAKPELKDTPFEFALYDGGTENTRQYADNVHDDTPIEYLRKVYRRLLMPRDYWWMWVYGRLPPHEIDLYIVPLRRLIPQENKENLDKQV